MDDLVKGIPSTIIAASVPAIFCFDELVDELSIDANPDPDGLSVAVIRNAFFAPSPDFITRVNVPSPAPNTLATTP